MGWPKGKSRTAVGGETRRDAPVANVAQGWETDIIRGAADGWSYQYMRENEVHDRGRSKLVMNRDTGAAVKVDGWKVVEEGEVEVSRERPDLAAPVDSTMRMGPHVLMKIPTAHWDLLQHEKDAVPDAIADRLLRGQASEDVGSDLVRFRQEKYAAHPALMGGAQR
jgi:hypothetical protein